MASSLDGIRIIDLTQMIAGPYCTQLLADLGADVIKVEEPASAPSRRQGRSPPVTGADGRPTTFSAWWLATNRNKRAMSLDLTIQAGRDVLRELVASADVVVENFGSGVREALGLTDEWARGANPSVIWASLSGFGRTGPDASREGWDLLAQARGGLMSLTGPRDGPPTKAGNSISDYLGGLHLAVAILAALRHRERDGQGQSIDISLLDCLVACLDGLPTWVPIANVLPLRSGNDHPMRFPGYSVYEARDGYVAIGAPPGPIWGRLAEAIARPDVAEVPDPRDREAWERFFERARGIVGEWISQRSRHEAREALDRFSVPNEAVQDVSEIWSDAQLKAREMFYASDFGPIGSVQLLASPLKLSETPVEYRRPPAEASQHTLEVLTELLGYTDEEIAALVDGGAIGLASAGPDYI